MMAQTVTTEIPLETQQIYTSCSSEELITVEMDAWKRGYSQAIADGPAAMRVLADVLRASEAACDEALLIYVPMDLARFRDVFMRAWSCGYHMRVKESEGAAAPVVS